MSYTQKATIVTNTTGAVLTSALLHPLIESGKFTFTRVFAAADIGDGKGQTTDQTDPSVGCLCGQIYGRILVVDLDLLQRPEVPIRTTLYTKNYIGNVDLDAGPITTNLNYYVKYDSDTNLSSIYILDQDSEARIPILSGDNLNFKVYLGNGKQGPFVPLG